MGLFSARNPSSPSPTPDGAPGDSIPLLPIDRGKRYDVYCSVAGEERVYEDVRFVALRQFEPVTRYSSGFGSYLEIEFANGARVLIPSFGIQILCERGVEPAYRVLRQWGSW
jgi:hypothetical protein